MRSLLRVMVTSPGSIHVDLLKWIHRSEEKPGAVLIRCVTDEEVAVSASACPETCLS